MNKLEKLITVIAMALVLGVPAFAGETPTPPCEPTAPGQVDTPPCLNNMSQPTEPGQMSTPPVADGVSLTGLAVNVLESILPLF